MSPGARLALVLSLVLGACAVSVRMEAERHRIDVEIPPHACQSEPAPCGKP